MTIGTKESEDSMNKSREATMSMSVKERLELGKKLLSLSPEAIEKMLGSPEAQTLGDDGKQVLEIALQLKRKSR